MHARTCLPSHLVCADGALGHARPRDKERHPNVLLEVGGLQQGTGVEVCVWGGAVFVAGFVGWW